MRIYTEPRENHALLDEIRKHFKLASDAELAKLIGLTPPLVSRIRSKGNTVSAETILRIHEVTGWPVAKIRALTPPQQR